MAMNRNRRRRVSATAKPDSERRTGFQKFSDRERLDCLEKSISDQRGATLGAELEVAFCLPQDMTLRNFLDLRIAEETRRKSE
ncbi:MAG: hypothetical protein CL793_07510 [Chloroflexi bacterium]|nr:hypothetical protein [Chloroflexota bacterium]